jgi:hypothetical protein
MDEFGQPKLQPIPGRLGAADAMGRSEQARRGGVGFAATSEDPSEDRMRRDHKGAKAARRGTRTKAGRVFASHLGNVVAARVRGMTHTTWHLDATRRIDHDEPETGHLNVYRSRGLKG